MTHPIRFAFMLVLTGICFIANAQPTTYPKDVEERIKKVEENLAGWIQTQDYEVWRLSDRMKLYNIPGISIAVIKDYKIDWAKGYGFADSAENRAVTTKTLFQAASLSKSVNAVGVLKLAQDKKIDLYTDINTYLKTWKFPYDSIAKGKTISTANLLSHTAGLTVHGFRGYANTEERPSVTNILNGEKPANSRSVRSQFEPGLRYQYSGGGTTITQLIVTDVTGKPYEQYMYENVLKPMGMTTSSYAQPPAADKKGLLATGYRGDGKEVTGKYHIYPEQAPAGLWTNPTELAKFIIEIQNAYRGQSKKVLSQESVKILLTPYIDKSAALGTFINERGNDKYFQHSGANEGFRCHYYGSLENGNGVIVMVNSDNGDIIGEIINSVSVVYQWKDFYKPIVKKTVTVADDILASYVGEYELAPQFIITVTKERGKLIAGATGQESFEIFPESDNKFFLKVVNAQLEFVKGEDGKIAKVILYQNGRANEGKKIK